MLRRNDPSASNRLPISLPLAVQQMLLLRTEGFHNSTLHAQHSTLYLSRCTFRWG